MYQPQSWQYTCDDSAEHIQHDTSDGWQHDSINDASNPLRNLAHDSAAFSSRSSWVLFLLYRCAAVVNVPCSLCKQLKSISSGRSLRCKSNSPAPRCPVVLLGFGPPWDDSGNISGTDTREILILPCPRRVREVTRFSLTESGLRFLRKRFILAISWWLEPHTTARWIWTTYARIIRIYAHARWLITRQYFYKFSLLDIYGNMFTCDTGITSR